MHARVHCAEQQYGMSPVLLPVDGQFPQQHGLNPLRRHKL